MIMRKADRTTEGDARVTFVGGMPSVVEGPFAEDTQLLAGYTMLDVNSKDEAIEWVKRNRAASGDAEVEIREVGCPAGMIGVSPPSIAGRPGPDPRYFILLKSEQLEAGHVPADTTVAAMAKRNAEATKAGVMLAGDGLAPSARGARVKFAGGKPTVIDGPFTEAKELIAGFWVIQVKSRQKAIEWVKRYPYPLPDVVVEILQIQAES
jgi:hypothetical protein